MKINSVKGKSVFSIHFRKTSEKWRGFLRKNVGRELFRGRRLIFSFLSLVSFVLLVGQSLLVALLLLVVLVGKVLVLLSSFLELVAQVFVLSSFLFSLFVLFCLSLLRFVWDVVGL